MAIRNLWQQAPQSIYEIKVGSWIQVCCGQGTCSMRDEDRTEAIFAWRFLKVSFDDLGDIYDLVIPLCCNGDCFHPGITLFLFTTQFFPDSELLITP